MKNIKKIQNKKRRRISNRLQDADIEIQHVVKHFRSVENRHVDDTGLYFKDFRKRRGIKKCQKCGRRLDNSYHHFLCDQCHD